MIETAKLMMKQAVSQLKATFSALAALRQEMQTLVAFLLECPVVMKIFSVNPVLGPQLIAVIGDICRFHSKKILVTFAGIDTPSYQSGTMNVHNRNISKHGSATLCRTFFLVISIIIQRAPSPQAGLPARGQKAFREQACVFMVTFANKFLRLYYAFVKAHLDALDLD